MNSQQLAIIRVSLNEIEQMCHAICSGNTKELIYVRVKMAEHLASMTLAHLQIVSSMFDKDQELLLEFVGNIQVVQVHMESTCSTHELIPELRAFQSLIGQIEHYITYHVYVSELVWPKEEDGQREEEYEIPVIEEEEEDVDEDIRMFGPGSPWAERRRRREQRKATI